MKKVIIIGCSGAGKSTFARKLRFSLTFLWKYAEDGNKKKIHNSAGIILQ